MENSFSNIISLVEKDLSTISKKYDSDSLSRYGKDWIDYFSPNPSIILFPQNTNEVIEILKFANQHLISVVPSGGRTGLSGGATAINGEIVISMEKMNKIIEVDTISGCITIQAGVTTQTIQEEAKSNGLMFPIDFASKGSSQIGGNIATNAGGIHVIKYGMTRNWVLAITVVTGSGQVLKLNKGLIKNATGYDLRHLFVGSEGTLGIITEATLGLVKQPLNRNILLISVQKIDHLTIILERFKKSIDLSAFEFFDKKGLYYSINGDYSKFPLSKEANAYAIIEFDGASSPTEQYSPIKDKAYQIIAELEDEGIILEDAYSEDMSEIKKIWNYRENVPVSLSKYQPYKNDLSVRIHLVPSFIHELDEILKINYSQFEVVWFGHIGDGNIHINILKPENLNIDAFKSICEKVSETISVLIKKYDGSISAEHGVGLIKKQYLLSSRSEEEIEYMKQIKKIFDPNSILNIGKLF